MTAERDFPWRDEVRGRFDKIDQTLLEEFAALGQMGARIEDDVARLRDEHADGVAALDAKLDCILAMLDEDEEPPPPQRTPFFAHLPWLKPDGSGYGRADWPAMIRERVNAGWATGAALYSSGRFTWDQHWDALAAEFPDALDLFLMPVDPTGAGDWCSHAPAGWQVWYSNGQEREDNEPDGSAAFRERSRVLKTDVSPFPNVRACVELNGAWLLGHGTTKALEMVQPDVVDFIGWSTFSPKPTDYASRVLDAVLAATAAHWPTIPFGMAAGAIGVEPGTPAGAQARVDRARINGDLLAAWSAAGGQTLAHYDVPHFAAADYGVDADLLPVLVAAGEVIL